MKEGNIHITSAGGRVGGRGWVHRRYLAGRFSSTLFSHIIILTFYVVILPLPSLLLSSPVLRAGFGVSSFSVILRGVVGGSCHWEAWACIAKGWVGCLWHCGCSFMFGHTIERTQKRESASFFAFMLLFNCRKEVHGRLLLYDWGYLMYGKAVLV